MTDAVRTASDRLLRVGVIGLGAIGAEHVDAYVRCTGAQLTAVVDQREDRRDETAKRTGARAFASLHEMLDSGCVDAVSLCTPDTVHFDDSCTLIRAGIDLLVEKPVATDPRQADALTSLAESTPVVVMPGQTLRFEPRYAWAREQVWAGKLGVVQQGYLRRDNLVSVAERVGGRTSVAFFLGIHDIDALQWITGERVVAVQAMASEARDASGRQSASILSTLRLSGGGVVQLESAWNLPETYPTELDADFRLVGSDSVLSVHSFDSGASLCDDRYRLPMTAGTSLYGASQGALALEVETFVRCCRERAHPPVSVREAASAVKVVVALERAVRTGGLVHVEPVAGDQPADTSDGSSSGSVEC